MNEQENDKIHPVCYRCHVRGIVQGVFFRASTRHEAQRLGLKGYAKNLPNGQVEVVVCGDPGAVDILKEWLREGPSQARVTGLTCEVVDYQNFINFSIA